MVFPNLLALLALLMLMCQLQATHELSICTIFQNDAPYLREWLEFHKLQGITHFYLYNNNSSDDYLSVLRPYLQNREVTVVNWPYTYGNGQHKKWIKIQSGAYKHCIKHYGKETKWLAAIDSDEFLFCPSGEKLPQFLKRYERFGGLCVNWLKFGTSHVEEIPRGDLLIEHLCHCYPQEDKNNRFFKSIVQPECVKDCKSAHFFLFKKNFFAANVNGEPISPLWGSRTKKIYLDSIRINHYWTRTAKYFREVKLASRIRRRNHFTIEQQQNEAEKSNQATDNAILQFVPALKAALQ